MLCFTWNPWKQLSEDERRRLQEEEDWDRFDQAVERSLRGNKPDYPVMLMGLLIFWIIIPIIVSLDLALFGPPV